MTTASAICGGRFACVLSKFDSLRAGVASSQPGGEVIAKRKGVIARWCLKEGRSKDAGR